MVCPCAEVQSSRLKVSKSGRPWGLQSCQFAIKPIDAGSFETVVVKLGALGGRPPEKLLNPRIFPGKPRRFELAAQVRRKSLRAGDDGSHFGIKIKQVALQVNEAGLAHARRVGHRADVLNVQFHREKERFEFAI